ncbi:DUF6266 family protein, partial [Marinifilum flexuosum]|uniref:DUF6266 family protein n=1 Tax=Marinifilum flexuosum TaxID=1117708 RepID=UPI0024941692
WKDESTTGVGNADDKLHLLVMSGDKVHILHANAARSDQSAEITLPVDPGATHIYAFFGTAEADEYSLDQYQMVNVT